MNDRPSVGWTIACVTVSVLLFALAISRSVYEATSPAALSWHIVLRKTYSIGAFALVGYTLTRAGKGSFRVSAASLAIALYSAGIEAGQYASGAREGWIWNATDIAMGAIGGALGALIAKISRRSGDGVEPPPRAQA